MEVDNLMVMPYIEDDIDREEQEDIWAYKEDMAWEDYRDGR